MNSSKILCTLAAIFIMNFANAQTYSAVANGTNGDIYAMQVYNDSLWLGGAFTECYSSDTITSPMLTIFDGTNFDLPTDSGWNGASVNCFYVNTLMDNSLFIGGDFNLPYDFFYTTNNVITYTSDSAIWGSNIYSLDNAVNAMINYNGKLYAAGSFSDTVGYVDYIAVWNDTAWANVASGLTDGEVRSLAVFNGYLYAGGTFSIIDGVPANYIAKWNGTTWQPVGLGLIGNVNALMVYDTLLYAGGNFILQGATTVNHIARIDTNDNYYTVGHGHYSNGLDSTGIGADTTADVRCFAVHDGILYIGGYFSEANGAPGNAVVAWNGNNYERMANGITSPSAAVYAMQDWNGSLYIAGSFYQADTIYANNICKYDAPAGIRNIQNNLSVQVYPNPATNVVNFNITNSNNQSGIIRLTDITGRAITSQAFHTGLNSIDVSRLDKGMYLYEIIRAASVSQGKFIVE